MLIEVEVCDVCQRVGVPVSRYTITEAESGRSGTTVRCGHDAESFEDVLRQPDESATTAAAEVPGPASEAAARPPRGRRARKVTTVDEIEAAKAAKA
ncbi:hypothetical protein [Streptomyces sp. NPDC057939]|uniref:hypothetical protein n=1 Tax=Streptomyces sp. NPDC057939 TaxID=3346284 RepID=UPI0036F14528